jgi:hypothetical protein
LARTPERLVKWMVPFGPAYTWSRISWQPAAERFGIREFHLRILPVTFARYFHPSQEADDQRFKPLAL